MAHFAIIVWRDRDEPRATGYRERRPLRNSLSPLYRKSHPFLFSHRARPAEIGAINSRRELFASIVLRKRQLTPSISG